MTGTGAYFYLVWGTWLRHCLNGRKDEYVLKWPSIFFSLPEIVPAISTKHTKRNGNGTTMPNIYMNENGTKNLQGEFQAKKEQ
jgi:dihydroceramidase